MQTSGDTPVDLAAQLLPIIDISDYYFRDRIENKQSSAISVNGAGTFTNASMDIPTGEAWIVTDISAQTNTLAVGNEMRIRAMIQYGGLNNTILVTYGEPTPTLVSGENANVGFHFDRPILLRPGDSVGLWNEHWLAGGANVTCFAQARIARLKL